MAQISGRLKKYLISEKKKLSRELNTFACPKLDQLVPIHSGPIDPILVYGPNLVFEIILFFPKKSVENGQNWLFLCLLYNKRI